LQAGRLLGSEGLRGGLLGSGGAQYVLDSFEVLGLKHGLTGGQFFAWSFEGGAFCFSG